jgi:hypothetical protein
MRPKLDILAMRERDIRLLLEQEGMAEALDAGELICSACSEPLTWETLGGFVIEEGKPVPFCNMSDCIESARGHVNG